MIENNGKKYVRVSAVLDRFFDKSKINPEVLERKKKLGTAVHAAIADEFNKEFPILTHLSAGYFDSFIRWKEALACKVLYVEKRFFDDEKMLTGCLDAIILLENHKLPVIVDFKTSSSESPTWVLQGHLYYYLANKNNVRVDSSMIFVKLSAIGEMPTIYRYKWKESIHNNCMCYVDDFWKNRKKASQ